MLETFTADTFRPRIGEEFTVPLDGGSETLRLSEVTPWGEGSADGKYRQPFTLLFHGPSASVLPQRTYRLENAEMGEFEIFLVPIGPDGNGMRYEAVFS